MTLFDLVATLSLDTTGFDLGVNTATSDGKTLAQRLGADAESIKTAFSNAFTFSLGQIMADAVQDALRYLADFTAESITAASDAEQTAQAVDVVFEHMGTAVHAWAKTTKENYGVGRETAKAYATELAQILSTDSYGFSAEQIYEYSTSLVELAGDLASFRNISVDSAWQKLLSGLRGETEAIESLGLDMRVGALADYFGMSDEDFSSLGSVEQWLYRYQYIMENTTKAQGDFARTEDTYANQLRVFEENVKELKATLGEGLLPVLTDLLTFANSLFGGAESAEEVMGGLQETFVGTYVDIDNTATSALALVEALERLEQQGVDTNEEESAWKALVNELVATLPELGGVIDTTTGNVLVGTQALKDYIAMWQTTQREAAYMAVMQDAYNEVAAQAKTVADLQFDLEVAKAQMGSWTVEDIVQDAKDLIYELSGRQYRGTDADDLMHALGNYDNSAEAQYLVGLYAVVKEAEAEVARLEAQLAGAEARLDEMNTEYALRTGIWQQLMDSYVVQNGAVDEASTLVGPITEELKTAISAAIQAGLEGVAINVNATLDSNNIVATVTRQITQDIRNKNTITGVSWVK